MRAPCHSRKRGGTLPGSGQDEVQFPARSRRWPGYPDHSEARGRCPQSFTRGCAARCCSGRSLKCQPTRPLNQMTISAHVDQRRWRTATIAIIRDHSRGRMAVGSGSSTAATPTGFSPNCYSTLIPVGIWKSAAPAMSGRAKLPVRSLAERLWQDGTERKRRRADSLHGSGDRSQSDSGAGSGIVSVRS